MREGGERRRMWKGKKRARRTELTCRGLIFPHRLTQQRGQSGRVSGWKLHYTATGGDSQQNGPCVACRSLLYPVRGRRGALSLLVIDDPEELS